MIASARLFRDQPMSGMPEQVAGIARDSRRVQPGEVYVALGQPQDRAAHIAEAWSRGAVAIITDTESPDPRWTFARASAALHGLDEGRRRVAGVTGTKGKSTITHMTWWCLGQGAARIGTIGWHDGQRETPNSQTTPPPEALHSFLAALGPTCPGVALEISSHGADQHRLAGVPVMALAVTGLGHDHLDYHGSMGSYLAAKLRAVQLVVDDGLVVLASAEPRAPAFLHAAGGRRVRLLGAGHGLERGGDGWNLDGQPLPTPLPGSFNAWNAAAAVLLAEALGVPRATAMARLATCPAVPGRAERLADHPTTYVDYAHTPESIAAILGALREAHPGAPLAIVVGCGGDRDSSKRAPMGTAASSADVVVLTTDNSRSESPAAIAAQIRSGIPGAVRVLDVPDRGEAIRAARATVGPTGVVVVAGKGHETTQDVGGVITPWDDRAFVRSLHGR